jgi:hypothetical protein
MSSPAARRVRGITAAIEMRTAFQAAARDSLPYAVLVADRFQVAR